MSVKVFRVKRVEVFLYRGRRIYQYKIRRHSEILIYLLIAARSPLVLF